MDRDEAVAEYMPYAKDRARWWATKHPALWDDIHAAAYLALVKALNARDTGPGIKGFISKCIDNEITSLLRGNDLIKIPTREIQRRKKGDLGFDDFPKVILVDDQELHGLRRSNRHPAWVAIYIKDVFRLLELTDHEREILILKSDGYSLSEIGEKLSRAKSSLSETLGNIRGRYIRLLRTHHELLQPRSTDEQA